MQTLARAGAYVDESTGLTGVNRLALTEADGEGRRLVMRWFEDAGLDVRIDQIGNVIGRRGGSEDLAPMMSGSHIDSVPTAGAFDGVLGVLSALEVVRALNDAGVTTRRPIEVAFFTEEEGCRFGTDMLGSAVAVGRIGLSEALALCDASGCSVGEALESIGFAGTAQPKLAPHAFVELHIEQGPLLAAHGKDVGVVTGAQGISWYELSISGRSAHAGTTPMNLRKDAALAAAKIAVHINDMTKGDFGQEMRTTMGRVELIPNRVNVVANSALCTVDLRNPDEAALQAAEADLASYIDNVAEELGVTIKKRQTTRTKPVAFDPDIQSTIRKHMTANEVSFEPILSGAGHDAQELATVCPTAMIFVAGEYDGISHNPREFSSEAACTAGLRVLCDVMLELST